MVPGKFLLSAAMNEQEFVAATLPDPFQNRAPPASAVGNVRKRGEDRGLARGGQHAANDSFMNCMNYCVKLCSCLPGPM